MKSVIFLNEGTFTRMSSVQDERDSLKKIIVESRQMFGLFIELKFSITAIYFLNFHKKCYMFVYKFASVYTLKLNRIRTEKL